MGLGQDRDPLRCSGLQPADVLPLLERGEIAVVIGAGFYERLEARQETIETLEE